MLFFVPLIEVLLYQILCTPTAHPNIYEVDSDILFVYPNLLIDPQVAFRSSVQSSFDNRESLKRRKPLSGRCSVRSDSLHMQNAQHSAGYSLSGSLTRVSFPRAYGRRRLHIN
jgi:hypothetical protein